MDYANTVEYPIFKMKNLFGDNLDTSIVKNENMAINSIREDSRCFSNDEKISRQCDEKIEYSINYIVSVMNKVMNIEYCERNKDALDGDKNKECKDAQKYYNTIKNLLGNNEQVNDFIKIMYIFICYLITLLNTHNYSCDIRCNEIENESLYVFWDEPSCDSQYLFWDETSHQQQYDISFKLRYILTIHHRADGIETKIKFFNQDHTDNECTNNIIHMESPIVNKTVLQELNDIFNILTKNWQEINNTKENKRKYLKYKSKYLKLKHNFRD